MSSSQLTVSDMVEPFEERLGSRQEPEILTLTEKKGFIAQSSKYKKRVAKADTSDYKVVRKYDLAFNPYLLWAGAIAQNTDYEFAIISPLYPTLRVKQEHDPRYCYYILSSELMRLYYDKISFGSVPRKRRAALDEFLNLPIETLPPLPEQKRIAAILDKADAVRRKRQEAIHLTEEFLRSVFLDMFGDLSFNPNKYPRVPLIEIAETDDGIKCGPFGTQLAKSEYRKNGVPLWGIKHVNSNFTLDTVEFLSPQKANDLRSYSISTGDLVMTRKGTVGNCSVYPDDYSDGIMHSDLLRIRLDRRKSTPQFMTWQLITSQDVAYQISLLSQGAIMAGINVTKLKSIEVMLPPLTLQNRFALIVRKHSLLLRKERAKLDLEEDLFNSLVQRAFQGDI